MIKALGIGFSLVMLVTCGSYLLPFVLLIGFISFMASAAAPRTTTKQAKW